MASKAITSKLLSQVVKERCGQNVYLCYFCRKCTSGCPVSEHMDLTPSELMRALQLDLDDQVLASKTIWLCAHCETCYTRCPEELDIPTIMDVLTNVVRERGLKPSVPEVELLNRLALAWIRRLGRMYEVGIMAERNLRSGKPFRDLDFGRRMFFAGKLKVLPSLVRYRPPRSQAEPHSEGRRVAYFPGCSQESSAIEYDESIRGVAEALGLELVEPEGWLCCGSGMGHSLPPVEAAAMPMKTLALAAAAGDSSMTMGCAACYSRFQRAVYAMEHDPELRQAVEKETKRPYDGSVRVRHFLETIVEDVGLETVGQRVRRPLEGLTVVPYYGCLLTRPPDVTRADHVENPTTMDRLLRRLGATVPDWSYKTDCCGASLMYTERQVALGLSAKLLRAAREVGAQTIAVACPFCHGNLDMRQEEMARELGQEFGMPIFYFTELMGLAFGLPLERLGLKRHFVDPTPLLRQLGLLPEAVAAR